MPFSWQPPPSLKLCLRPIGMGCYGKKLATAYLRNWQPQSGSTWRPWMKSLDDSSLLITRLAQIPLSNPSSSWEWPNPRFTRFFRTWRTEGPQKKKTCKWTACSAGLTKGKRKQLVNAAMDNNRVSLTKSAKKLGVHQVYVQRVFKWEGLKYYKRKFTKADFWEGQRPDSRSLVRSSWPWWLKKPTTAAQAVMDVSHIS